MLWILCSVLALFAGLAMFSKLQPELPPELAWLKGTPTSALVVTQDPAANKNRSAIPSTSGATQGWTIRTDGKSFEATIDFDQAIVGPAGQAYDKPAFGVTCYQNQLFARVNTRITADSEGGVRFQGKPMPAWTAAGGQNWYSANARAALAILNSVPNAKLDISFVETRKQTFTLNMRGLPAVLAQMPGCKD